MLLATSQKPSTRDTMMTWSVWAPMPLGDYVVAGREGCADVVIHAPSFRDYADLACGLIRPLRRQRAVRWAGCP
jgi:hypothetical protein